MDFRASGVRSLKLNIFLILKEVKTNLILRSASQKRLSNCRSLSYLIVNNESRLTVHHSNLFLLAKLPYKLC